jgi:pilus assembly protein CpaF
MSLLKRIERARPAAEGQATPAVPAAPAAPALTPEGGAEQPPGPPVAETPPPPAPPASTTAGVASRFSAAMPARESFREAKFRVQNRLINELDPKLDLTNQVEVRRQIEELFGKIADEEGLALTRAERVRMLEQITDEILGLGPLEPLLRDETLTEVMVNGPQQVYIERDGKLELTNVTFQNDEHVMKIIQRIIAPIGRRVDESSPMVDARLADGSRVNAIIPPLSLVGPVITIRKFSATPYTVDDLVRFGTSTPEMFEFLEACVKARLNVFVSGGTGSGKTTMLNILSSFIPDDERIVTIEDAAELQLRQEHVVTLEARPSNIEGKGAVPIRELVRNSLRMRPDRIVVGECRSAEALDMLQAMNTGHDGSMSTGHANTPRDMLSRLETMVLMAGMDLPLRAIREQISSAVDLIVHQNRLKDGTRKIVNITEVQGMEGDVIVMQDVFVFEQTGVSEGRIQGRLKPTGIRPHFVERFETMGVHLPPNIFGTPF